MHRHRPSIASYIVVATACPQTSSCWTRGLRGWAGAGRTDSATARRKIGGAGLAAPAPCASTAKSIRSQSPGTLVASALPFVTVPMDRPIPCSADSISNAPSYLPGHSVMSETGAAEGELGLVGAAHRVTSLRAVAKAP